MMPTGQQTTRLPNQPSCKRVGWFVAILLAAGLLATATTRCLASNGDNITLPISRTNKPIFSKQSGLQIAVDSTWAGTRGYRPVAVTASMATAATADTQITIQFFAGSWRSSQRAIVAEHDFELPQGSNSATAKFSVPQFVDWNTFGWDIWVDGVKDDKLSLNTAGFNGGANGAIAAGQFELGTGQWNSNGTSLLQAVANNAVEGYVFNLSNLPESWVDYSPLDVVTTTTDVLELARVSAPERLSALLRWVRAGGNLWVLDVGLDFEDLSKLEKLLAIDSSDAAENSDNDATSGNWSFLKLNGTGRTRLNDIISLTMDQATDDQALTRSEIADSEFADTAVDSRRWFVAHAYGLGMVVAIQEAANNRGRGQNSGVVTALQRSTLAENLQWTARHGNDPGTGNPDFNNLLISDVGAAPVFEFQMLISLFVIGIGPVNYWLLKRRNQLPVLLLTVPIAALAATLMLFTYGFLADGIGTRVRARSLTVLDQKAGEAASWARLSYYAGIAPSDGLKMPSDTTVYPILPSRSEQSAFGSRQVNQQRSVEWANEQKLTRGWLGSRTPTQYLTVTARATQKQLQFEPMADGLKATNRLGTEISTLIVQDHEGNIFLGSEVAADGSAILKPSTFIEAASALRLILTQNLPQLPPGYVESRRYRSSDYGASMTDGLLELQFEAIGSPAATGWGNGSYVAFTTEGIELSLGLTDVEEANSLHVVRGTW